MMINNNKSLCNDIYEVEVSRAISTLKRLKESWLGFSFCPEGELFQYADDDFYFYRYVVDRQQRATIDLLNRIIYSMLNRYAIDFETPSIKNEPYDFIINTKDGKFGYMFKDLYEDEDINELNKTNNIDKAFIIRTVKGKENAHIIRNNNYNKLHNVSITEITIQNFFESYFSTDEYYSFEEAISKYITQSRTIMGYQTIKTLSDMNLSVQKEFEEKSLASWDYEHSKFKLINSNNIKIEKMAYVGNDDLKIDWSIIRRNYIDKKLYKAMVGSADFAESFVTSEWIYFSLKGKDNFDYTAVVSGYLKSIEQLLYMIVMLNIDNNCVISLKNDKAIKKKIRNYNVTVYDIKWDKNTKSIVRNKVDIEKDKWPSYLYIDFTTNYKEYIDNSIGTFEFFLRNNPEIFFDSDMSKIICDMVSCFRIECRNGYFHTHNLHDETIVDKIRENAILLYSLLLGSVKKIAESKTKLGILQEDKFVLICKELKDLRHYSIYFTFVCYDGTEKKMVYDAINNSPKYTKDGMEYYESLIFYEVSDFSLETVKKLDTPIKQECKYLLTKDNLPLRIFCYDIKNNIHEVSPYLLNE